MSKRIQSVGFVIVFCFTLLVSVNLSTVGTVDSSSGYGSTILDPTGASVGQVGTFPAQNGQLLPDENYNLTASLRDEANLGRAYDGGYLTVTKGGDVYQNTSFTPLGTFPGTYSFEDDRSGGLAEGFTYMVGTGASVQVVESYLGHHKCLQVISGTTETRATNDFPAQASGTITLWYLVTTPFNYNIVIMLAGSTRIAIDGGTWRYYNGAWTNLGISASANHWYYVNLTWSGSNFRLCIDGETLATFTQVVTVNSYATATGTMGGAYSYVDAVDYSWSSGYVANRSGVDLSQFGIYNGTCSFEKDAPFSVPMGWVNSSAGTGVNSYTVPAVPTAATGHKNVLCLTDSSGTNLASAHYNFTAKTAGRIGFWTFLADTGYVVWTTLDANGQDLSACDIQHGNVLHAYTTGAGELEVMTVSINTWYYLEFSFNAGVWDLYVNGLLKASGLGYYSSSSNPATCFLVRTGGTSLTTFYVDAVDFSWDLEYTNGRASYMQLQQNITFAEEGSYSFRYALSSSGADYPGVWTPFSVLAPEVPQVPTHGIFFSASSEDLVGVPEDSAFLYVDDALKSWGTVELVNGTHNITVRDYFGVILSTQEALFNTSGNHGIVLPMATLVANNYNDKPAALEITKSGGTGTLRQLMGPQDSFAVRLAPGNYHVRLYDLDGTLIGEHTLVTLTASANQEVDFGTAPSLFSMDWMILVGLIAVCAVLIIVAIGRSGRGRRR